jgi:D-glycero-alpha-D-manno-heptose 1-phosphate guanylyltransferase
MNPDALILCGGMGTRLSSVVNDRQKCVSDVGGRPFLSYVISNLCRFGRRRIILCTGYQSETVKKLLSLDSFDAEFVFSHETVPLGTGGAIRQAISLSDSEDVLIMNGDSFIDCDLEMFQDEYYRNSLGALMLLTEVEDVSRFGRVTLDGKNRIIAFEEKGASGGAGLINAGVYLLKKSLIGVIPVSCPFSLEKQFFPKLIEGKTLYGFRGNGKFIDIGIRESYIAASEFFKR